MRRQVKYNVLIKHKRSKAVKNNAAANPFVIAGLLAAITVVVFTIIFLWYKATL